MPLTLWIAYTLLRFYVILQKARNYDIFAHAHSQAQWAYSSQTLVSQQWHRQALACYTCTPDTDGVNQWQFRHSCEPMRCEPTRRTAYSKDLRWRIVWQREVQGLTLSRVAANLCVDTSTVLRIVQHFEPWVQWVRRHTWSTTCLSNLPASTADRASKKPGIYFWDIQQEISPMISIGTRCIPFPVDVRLGCQSFMSVHLSEEEQLQQTFQVKCLYPLSLWGLD